jgi:hypothetical protein
MKGFNCLTLWNGILRSFGKSEQNKIANNNTDNSIPLTPSANDTVPSASATYRHYTASDKQAAMNILNEQKITVPSYYVIVETPEGTFSKDMTGIIEL